MCLTTYQDSSGFGRPQPHSRKATIRMKTKTHFLSALALGFALIAAAWPMATLVGAAPPRPQGPCDIYGAAGTPCVTAHSTTRALYAAYNGPLYQIKRL